MVMSLSIRFVPLISTEVAINTETGRTLSKQFLVLISSSTFLVQLVHGV